VENKRVNMHDSNRRYEAEERQVEMEAMEMIKRDDDDTLKPNHDLQVHLVTLEEQNEVLRQARAEIEAGLKKYSALYDFAPVGYFNLSDDDLIQEVNFTGASLLGYERSQLINRHFSAFLAEESRPVFADFLRKIYEDPTKKTCELLLSGDKGNPKYVHIEGFAAEANAGMDWQCLMAVLDITDRCRIEAKLRRSEERYRTIFENATEGIFQTTPEGRFVSANPSAARMFGYASPEELQAAMGDISLLLYKHPDDRERMLRLLAEEGHVVNYEAEMYRKDGRIVWVSINAHSVRGPDDAILFFEGTFQDITDRKRAEEKLRTTRDFLENLLNYANAPVIVWDSEYRITLFNHAFERLTGRGAEEVIGKDISLLFPEDGRDKSMAYIRQASAGERWETVEISIQDARGEVHILLWNSANLLDADGRRRVATIAQGQDITERIKAEEERRKIELGILQTQKLESIGVLAGGIAHDFNNMLMVVLGNTDLALANISEETPVYKRLTDIRTVSIRAADLCRQLLAYAGKGRYLVEPVNLSSMVEEMTSMFDVSISKKVFLNYNLAKWLPPIEADASQIRQIIMNLVINASEAIGEKSGAIYISTSVMECDQEYLAESNLQNDLKQGYYVCLEIADTGSGMERETVEKIFDPFFTTKSTGRGLGLAAVLGIVRGHKGGIKVYSEPGEGTTFRLLFPVAEELAESTAMFHKKEVDTWKGSGTVLLVDDDESVRSLSRLILEHIGFDVLLAEDGRKALKIFSEHKQEIRCIILDLTMPHMGGEETFQELRRIDPHVRIIMSSGYNEQDVVHRFIGKGISGFIQKPYLLKNLTHTLMKILEEEDDRAGDN